MDTTWFLIIFVILVLLAYLWYSGDSKSEPTSSGVKTQPTQQPMAQPMGPVYQEVGDYSEDGEHSQQGNNN